MKQALHLISPHVDDIQSESFNSNTERALEQNGTSYAGLKWFVNHISVQPELNADYKSSFVLRLNAPLGSRCVCVWQIIEMH